MVTDQDDGNSKRVAARDPLARTREHAHILRATEILGVFDDHAVAVEKEGRPTGQPLRPGIDLVPRPGSDPLE